MRSSTPSAFCTCCKATRAAAPRSALHCRWSHSTCLCPPPRHAHAKRPNLPQVQRFIDTTSTYLRQCAANQIQLAPQECKFPPPVAAARPHPCMPALPLQQPHPAADVDPFLRPPHSLRPLSALQGCADSGRGAPAGPWAPVGGRGEAAAQPRDPHAPSCRHLPAVSSSREHWFCVCLQPFQVHHPGQWSPGKGLLVASKGRSWAPAAKGWRV